VEKTHQEYATYFICSYPTFKHNSLHKIKKDRRAAISFPLFDLTKGPVDVAALELLGVFCIDTSTALTETGWILSQIPPVLNKHVAQEGIEWADVLSVILKMLSEPFRSCIESLFWDR
jgi:hypothetical protein